MIGTDPEFFILDAKGKPSPAWLHFPPKEAKAPARREGFEGVRGQYFRDGYVLEVNTGAETCRGRFGNALRDTINEAKKALPAGFTLASNAAMEVDLKDMVGAPPDCQVFGCDPSFNAYEEAEMSVDLDPAEHPFRYAGGHMHMSAVPSKGNFVENKANKFMFAKLCDLFIGLPLAYLYDEEDEAQRRLYYGRAGESRHQKYPDGTHGVEYRVPSPRIYNEYHLASMLFGVMRTLATNFSKIAPGWNKKWDKPLQKAINNCEVTEKMLQTMPGFYTPELLVELKKRKAFKEFKYPECVDDCHSAFTEWCQATFKAEIHPQKLNEHRTAVTQYAYSEWQKYLGHTLQGSVTSYQYYGVPTKYELKSITG